MWKYLLFYVMCCGLLVFLDVGSASEVPSTGQNLQLSTSGDFPAIQQDGHYRFYLDKTNLTLQCRIQSATPVTPSLSPTITFENSTWRQTYTFPPRQDNSSLLWMMTLTREHVNLEANVAEWLPLEQWKATVGYTHSRTTLEAKGSLIDVASNPHLFWRIGERVETAPIDVLRSVDITRVRRSPCTPDVAVVALKTAASRGFYLARTRGAFESDTVEWFRLNPAEVCTSECDSVFLVDVILTNHHLVVLTSAGLLLSNDLRSVDVTLTSVMEFSYVLNFDMPSSSVKGVHACYTGCCLSRQFDLEGLPGDTITVTLQKQNGESQTWYSQGPFDSWSPLVTHLTGVKLIDSCHSSHTNSLMTLVQTQAGTKAVEVTKFNANMTLKAQSFFPAFHFPVSASIDHLAILPTSQLVYAFGEDVWFSEDGGNSFRMVHSLKADSVVMVTSDFKDQTVVMETTNGSLLYGKPGVVRLVPLSSATDPQTSAVYIDFFMQILKVQLDVATGTFTANVISTTKQIRDHDFSSAHPVVLQLISDKEVLLFEHSPLNATDTPSSAITARNIGQIFSAIGGGSGVVMSVSYTRMLPGYLSVVSLRMKMPFLRDNTSITPAQKLPLRVDYTDVSRGEAVLVLDSCCYGEEEGWQEGDVSKTVVVPGTTSFLLTSYLNESHIEGAAVVLTRDAIYRPPNAWFVVDLGVHSGAPQWTMKEAECGYQLTPIGSIRSRSQFELDIDDSLTAALVINTTDHPSDQSRTFLYQRDLPRPVMYAALSNPWPFKSNSDQKVLLSTSEYIHSVTIKSRAYIKGVTALRFHVPHSSLLCPVATHTIVVFAACPCQKRLVFVYPLTVSDHDFLNGDPRDKDNNSILQPLEVNYRPPSRLGVGIPTSEHVYNVDPSKPRPRNTFRVSQESGVLKQCAGALDHADCNCTDHMRLSADPHYSDCRQRAFRLLHPGILNGNFVIVTPDQPDIPLDNDKYVVVINEINDRAPSIGRQKAATESVSPLLLGLQNDGRFTDSHDFREPTTTQLIMDGSGLYHYHAQVIRGLSYCSLSVYFQVYVVQTPIAYPLQYILNFATGVVIGGLFFFLFLWYLVNHHVHRPRCTGTLCLAKQDISALNFQTVEPPL